MQPKQCITIINSIKAYAKQNPTEAQVYEDWFQAVVNLRDALPRISGSMPTNTLVNCALSAQP